MLNSQSYTELKKHDHEINDWKNETQTDKKCVNTCAIWILYQI